MSRILPWLASRVRFLIFPSYFRRVLHDVSKVSRHQSSLGLGLLQKYRLEFITVFYFFRGFELNQSDIFNHTVKLTNFGYAVKMTPSSRVASLAETKIDPRGLWRRVFGVSENFLETLLPLRLVRVTTAKTSFRICVLAKLSHLWRVISR